jgi:hypothetical protein
MPRKARKLIISHHDAALRVALRLFHGQTADERDREERIRRGMLAFAALGSVAIEHTVH